MCKRIEEEEYIKCLAWESCAYLGNKMYMERSMYECPSSGGKNIAYNSVTKSEQTGL